VFIALCHCREWPTPEFVPFRAQDGYTCEVKLSDNSYHSGATSWHSEIRAREAAGMVAFLALRKSSTTFMSTNKRDLITKRTAVLYEPGAISARGSTSAFSIWLHATQHDEEIVGKPRGVRAKRYYCLGNQKTTQPVAIFWSCSRNKVFAPVKVREGASQPDAINRLEGVSRHYSSSSDSRSIKSFKTATTVDTVHTIATIDTFRTATTIETFHTASTVKTFHTAHSRQQPLFENGHQRNLAQQAMYVGFSQITLLLDFEY
jgi:hypothetical protein